VKKYIADIEISDYDYDLPEELVAQYPVNERDSSKVLIYKDRKISSDIFSNIDNSLPADSLLVFNNTRVIRARLLFRKQSGASIEILCLEPLSPIDYELSFSSKGPVEWKCIVGNLKKWKREKIAATFNQLDNKYELTAEKIKPEGDAWRIRFCWNSPSMSFGEVIEATGHIPLPPYIKRADDTDDINRYQTVYSSVNGSVAAPTAGLHFTDTVFEKLVNKGIKKVEVTLHIGAGTFKPVKSENISGHEMHCEHFLVTVGIIESIRDNYGKIIPVGTTSVRTLESLYWLGVKLILNPSLGPDDLSIGQWEPYETEFHVSAEKSMEALLEFMKEHNSSQLHGSTSLIIIPGYKFHMINGMITNFHQPKSTLLLLISAWLGTEWKRIYSFAVENDFRFLSYGDCSLFLR
jgi:S-adenosylmethionine:tRNA ribosyltransferase-isomerase